MKLLPIVAMVFLVMVVSGCTIKEFGTNSDSSLCGRYYTYYSENWCCRDNNQDQECDSNMKWSNINTTYEIIGKSAANTTMMTITQTVCNEDTYPGSFRILKETYPDYGGVSAGSSSKYLFSGDCFKSVFSTHKEYLDKTIFSIYIHDDEKNTQLVFGTELYNDKTFIVYRYTGDRIGYIENNDAEKVKENFDISLYEEFEKMIVDGEATEFILMMKEKSIIIDQEKLQKALENHQKEKENYI